MIPKSMISKQLEPGVWIVHPGFGDRNDLLLLREVVDSPSGLGVYYKGKLFWITDLERATVVDRFPPSGN